MDEIKTNPFNEIEKSLEWWKNFFLKELQIKNSSPKTLTAYKRIIDDFIEFCYLERVNEKSDLKIENINKYFMLSYINELKKRLKDSSVFYYFKVIKIFLKYISENNEEGIDVLEKVEKIKIKTKQTVIPHFSKSESEKVEKNLIQIMENTKNYNKLKNALSLYFIKLTGMRAKEVINLMYKNVSSEENFYRIIITGKGNKERILFIKKEKIKRFVDKYLQKRSLNSEYFFVDLKGRPLTYIGLLKFNQRFLRKICIYDKKKYGLHIYRHTFAVEMTEKNVNLNSISEWLGHSSISITAKYYAKVNENAKKNIANLL